MRFARLTVLLAAISAFAALPTVDETGFQKLVHSNKGKVVLYDFWATWCHGCREELPRLVQLEAKLRARGFELVTISADDPDKAAEAATVLQQLAFHGQAYRKQAQDDDHFINSVDKTWSGALPALFLYDKNGNRVRSFIGETDNATLEAAIRKVL